MKIKLIVIVAMMMVLLMPLNAQSDEGNEARARHLIEKALEAMGGDSYRKVDRIQSSGRYFWFNKGRKFFQRYKDWSVMAPEVKSRVQLGKGKEEYMEIVNLEINKGWRRESEKFIEFFTDDQLSEFMRTVRLDLDYLLRERLSEEGMSLFFYGKDEISGEGRYEAVEFVDSRSDSIIVYFNISDSRPARTEYHSVDGKGIRHKKEQEFYNWHEVQGVMVPLRVDIYTDEELSSQRFVEEISFNGTFEEELFTKPEGEIWLPRSKREKN